MEYFVLIYFIIALVVLSLWYSFLKVQTSRAKAKLKSEGYQHIFNGSSDNYIAINSNTFSARLGNFFNKKKCIDINLSQIHKYEKITGEDEKKKRVKFVFYTTIIDYPIHEVLYDDTIEKADFEWARIQAIFKNPNLLVTMSQNTVTSAAKYDFFISHAGEDKESLVRPLAQTLSNKGFKVWYDEMTLTIGDSLRRSIDSGLSNSKYGIVILSENFFIKQWPQYELDGLVTEDLSRGKVILPIWHGVDRADVAKYSPTLADKIAFSTATMSVEDIVNELSKLLHKDA